MIRARKHLPQPITVVNRPGASGMIGHGEMINARPDGYKLALEDRLGFKYNMVPFGGAAPAVLALLGGHIDAVAVSPGEVATHVAGGKLRTLAVFADKRLKGFDNVPTLKERGIDLSLSTWRGLAAPKGTPPEVIAVLAEAARKIAAEPSLK